MAQAHYEDFREERKKIHDFAGFFQTQFKIPNSQLGAGDSCL
jgi:hypothetical protein